MRISGFFAPLPPIFSLFYSCCIIASMNIVESASFRKLECLLLINSVCGVCIYINDDMKKSLGSHS